MDRFKPVIRKQATEGWVALLVGGNSSLRRQVTPHLESAGIYVVDHWEAGVSRFPTTLPVGVTLVVCLYEMIGHKHRDNAKYAAESRGVPFVELSRKWAIMHGQLERRGLLRTGAPMPVLRPKLVEAPPPLAIVPPAPEPVVEPQAPEPSPPPPAPPVVEAPKEQPMAAPKPLYVPPRGLTQEERAKRRVEKAAFAKKMFEAGEVSGRKVLDKIQETFGEGMDLSDLYKLRDAVLSAKGVKYRTAKGSGRKPMSKEAQPTVTKSKTPNALPDDVVGAIQLLKEALPGSGVQKLTLTFEEGGKVRVAYEVMRVSEGAVEL